MTIRILEALASVLLLSALATGQDQQATPPQMTELAATKAYTRTIDQFTKANARKRRLFGNVAGVEDKLDKWREFKTAKQMERADEGDNLDESANVWLKDGDVVAAHFSFTSPSGDWVHYVNYYFRADGTLAKIHAQLNTFSSAEGGLSVVREKFYGAKSRVIHASTRYLDLKSQRPTKATGFLDQPIPVYKNVRALPFAKLLHK